MFWTCDECREWGVAETDVDAAVDRQRHLNSHRGADVPPPAAEEEPDEGTVLNRTYVAWGITALLGLLSARFPSLVGVVPWAALIAFVVTYSGQG
ncbi:hypothetical protein [Streptomyces sp. NPDC002088]|uniref:hypothetical protein n=1 Tax=Streptomyces sp. NPDC002088 TaxID=3154665 RepID=UPI00331C4761